MPGGAVQNALDVGAQGRQVLFDHGPDGSEIDTEVGMDQAVSDARDLAPGNGGLALGQRRAEVLDCLANDFLLADDSALRLAVCHEDQSLLGGE